MARNSLPTFLLVEDDPNDLFLALRQFEKAGCRDRVHTAENARSAIEWLMAAHASQSLPDFVLIDYRLPDESGSKILEWMDEHLELPLPKRYVFVSSSGDSRFLEKRGVNPDGFIDKPLEVCRIKALEESARTA